MWQHWHCQRDEPARRPFYQYQYCRIGTWYPSIHPVHSVPLFIQYTVFLYSFRTLCLSIHPWHCVPLFIQDTVSLYSSRTRCPSIHPGHSVLPFVKDMVPFLCTVHQVILCHIRHLLECTVEEHLVKWVNKSASVSEQPVSHCRAEHQ